MWTIGYINRFVERTISTALPAGDLDAQRRLRLVVQFTCMSQAFALVWLIFSAALGLTGSVYALTGILVALALVHPAGTSFRPDVRR